MDADRRLPGPARALRRLPDEAVGAPRSGRTSTRGSPQLLGVASRRSGSNAFAVGGARTASGSPLIGADPHRVFEVPGDLPAGRPRLRRARRRRAGLPGRARASSTSGTPDTSRGRSPTRWPTTRTSRSATAGWSSGPRRPSSATSGLSAVLPLLRARTVADVDAALEHWVEPVNNVLVADTTGRVLHRVAGRVPVARRRRGSGPGWADLPRIEVAARRRRGHRQRPDRRALGRAVRDASPRRGGATGSPRC